MSELFQKFLEGLATRDGDLLQNAVRALKTAERYRALSQGKLLPQTKDIKTAIKHANAMRVVQFGEAVKTLMKEKVFDNSIALAIGISPRTVASMRDTYAHPERHTEEQNFDFENVSSRKEELVETLEVLGELAKENALMEEKRKLLITACVQKGKDALEHLTDEAKISITVFNDAENYMRMYAGGCLEELSVAGANVLNDRTRGLLNDRISSLPEAMIKIRRYLAHKYETDGCDSDPFAGVSLGDILLENKKSLNHQAYQKGLLDDKCDDPKMQQIVAKWHTANVEETPQKPYGNMGCRFVLEEISFLAKSKADAKQIRQLSEALEVALRSPDEVKNTMLKKYPCEPSFRILPSRATGNRLKSVQGTAMVMERDKMTWLQERKFLAGPDEKLVGSLRRLNARASQHGKGKTSIFDKALQRICEAYGVDVNGAPMDRTVTPARGPKKPTRSQRRAMKEERERKKPQQQEQNSLQPGAENNKGFVENNKLPPHGLPQPPQKAGVTRPRPKLYPSL